MAALQTLSPEQAIARKDRWGIPGVALACTAVEATNPEETVLACQWGRGDNAMFDGRLLVWRQGGEWKSQPFPAEAVRGVGYFRRLYRDGDDLIVILNVARGMTMGTEQVQVFSLDGRWQVAWLPDEAVWTQGHATVTFVGPGHDRFVVDTDSYNLPPEERGPFAESNAGDHRPFREEWVKEQQGYRRVSRIELPSEYGAVVHFVTALVRGDLAEAERWASGPDVLNQARELGVLNSAEKGYFTRREGSTAEGWGPDGPMFRLYTNDGTECPSWLVRVMKRDGRWVVSAILDPSPLRGE